MPVIGTENGCERVTLFSGMAKADLQAALLKLQQAYLDLMSGDKGESYTYTQGDGSKSVTYTRANIAGLASTIAELQQMLGMDARRRPIKFWFGANGGNFWPYGGGGYRNGR